MEINKNCFQVNGGALVISNVKSLTFFNFLVYKVIDTLINLLMLEKDIKNNHQLFLSCAIKWDYKINYLRHLIYFQHNMSHNNKKINQ